MKGYEVTKKNRRILVFGNSNSKWVMRFIKTIYFEGFDITLINDAQLELTESKTKYDYYHDHNIKVITINDSNLYTRCLKCMAVINQMNDFEVCHILFMSQYACLTAKICEKKFGVMIGNFFGTDFYKASILMQQEQKQFLNRADTIIVTTDKMQDEVVVRYPEFAGKVHTVYFESPVFQILTDDSYTMDIEIEWMNRLDDDKIVIAAAYKGGSHQQHEMFIRALNNCDKMIRDKVFVVFMMTYGMTESYLEEIQKLLMNAKFEYSIVKEFLTDEQMAEFRKRVDIFVNTVMTDAFNAAIQESLYCQTVILCGRWLNYPQLRDENAFIVYFDNASELSESLKDVILDMEGYKEKSKGNRDLIKRICTKRQHIEDWSRFYGDIRYQHKDTDINELFMYMVDHAKLQNDRNRLYKDTMECWIRKKMKMEAPICRFIQEHDWNRVIPYGAGSLGELVYEEIKKMDIEIYVSDRYVREVNWFHGTILQPSELKDEMADKILVTSVHLFTEIKTTLQELVSAEKIISLMEILKTN